MEILTDIKLNTGIDWVSAEALSIRTAIVKGISRNYEIGFDDLVLFDPVKKRITQVIKKNSNTLYVSFKENAESYRKINNYFGENDIRVESIIFGIAGLGIPVGISDEDFQIIFHNCPVDCEIIVESDNETKGVDEDEDDDFDEDYY